MMGRYVVNSELEGVWKEAVWMNWRNVTKFRTLYGIVTNAAGKPLLHAVQGDPVRTVTSNCNGTELCGVRGPSLVCYVPGLYSLVVATKNVGPLFEAQINTNKIVYFYLRLFIFWL